MLRIRHAVYLAIALHELRKIAAKTTKPSGTGKCRLSRTINAHYSTEGKADFVNTRGIDVRELLLGELRKEICNEVDREHASPLRIPPTGEPCTAGYYDEPEAKTLMSPRIFYRSASDGAKAGYVLAARPPEH